ncbi:uncharacterized protein LOC114361136 [Ostrinia furnacalis]|uniref:uncharacterized protein LOC114361136 n=1 Tax=Ostrinia furnacalis TaxID=93504 RepID=UPI00103AA0AB|nr:uncharacterized protein LOC114361136 [Ostrinia furnacalis]XP_028171885.1 uncharacterized protein LOC114361136 [Ostrinia furnacalis]XP_028171886.1 uncharacterized protein LOC114361136 [Ostrinia furnacalis]
MSQSASLERHNQNNQDDDDLPASEKESRTNQDYKMQTDKQLTLATDNLGSRQRALNKKVNDAFSQQVNFEIAKCIPENTKIDRLFKIDLAAKYKNVDYIIETLKSGDEFYTARALRKCKWLFKDQYSDVLNPEYLYENIFSVTSMRVKKKILKTTAKYIKNPDRAVQFYNVCMQEKMLFTAFNCLINTSVAFKLETLPKLEGYTVIELEKKFKYFKLLIGKSFEVLDALLNIYYKSIRRKTVFNVKYLYYTVSKEKYLDVIEKWLILKVNFITAKFGAKISNSIMKYNKDRVLAKPHVYYYILDTEAFIKHSTIDDAKIYADVFFSPYRFWDCKWHEAHKPIFDIIGNENFLPFLKNFVAKIYPLGEFEMHRGFYDMEYYKFMNPSEKQEWALSHLKRQDIILGLGNEYRWYRFIEFELAFPEIKKLIDVTDDTEQRTDMCIVLLESAKNNQDLQLLFDYYNKVHLDELRTCNDFLKKVISHHNVFEFDDDCWATFYKILLSVNLYSSNDATNINYFKSYKTMIVLYHILHEKPFPDELMKYFLEEFDLNSVDDHIENVGYENYKKILDFFYDFYVKQADNKCHRHRNSKDEAAEAKPVFAVIKSAITIFYDAISNVAKSDEQLKIIPKLSLKILSGRQLLQDLKEDKTLVISKVTEIKNKYENASIKLDKFLDKIMIYFSEDVTKVYLAMFEDLVSENKNKRTVHAGVRGILKLGDENAILEIMGKHAPANKKDGLKNDNIDQLRIQRAICMNACISRPHVPPAIMVKYMKGCSDKYYLHILKTYFAIFPSPICLELLQLLLDTPVSRHKHAIQLAFECCTAQSLIKVITNIWTSTKNKSTRSVIYETILNKVADTKNRMLLDMLLKFTSGLRQTDENEVFDLVVSKKLPDDLLGDYIEAVWDAVNSFEDKQPNIGRKQKVIHHIQNILDVVKKSFVSKIIEQHMNMMIKENKLKITYAEDEISQLCKEKWKLVARYVIHHTRPEYSLDESMLLSRSVIENSIENWDKVIYDDFLYQKLLCDFFCYLEEASFKHNVQHFEDAVPIFEDFLALVKSSLPLYDTYKLRWDLQLAIISRQVIGKCKSSFIQASKKTHRYDVKDLHNVIIDAFKVYSHELAKAISKYANEVYVVSFSLTLKEIVEDNIKQILEVFKYYLKIINNYIDIVRYLDEIMITVASGLIENELPATFLLAVQLLPHESPSGSFLFAIEKLQKCSYQEVLYVLHQRFRKVCNTIRDSIKTDSTDEDGFFSGLDIF